MSIEWRSVNLCAPEERNVYSRGDPNPNTRHDHILLKFSTQNQNNYSTFYRLLSIAL